ncbi:unnamed protein product, partial [Mesorhabditis belari]|uniref:G protein-coupled receptor n=1 Tax=Mesorhabditis belari TaxID=2138241 RepID=A0AAF3F7R8_9BILA
MATNDYIPLDLANLHPPDESLCEAAGQLGLFTLYSIQKLITFKMGLLFVYAMNNCISHGHLLVLRVFFGGQPCMFVLSAIYCLPLKIIHLCVSTCLSTTLFMILLERAIVVFSQHHSPLSNSVAKGFIFLELLGMIGITSWALSTELRYDFQVLHCMEDTPTSLPLVNSMSEFCIAIDTITLISAILLVVYCRRRIKKRHIDSLHYSYSLRYSEIVLQGFLPIIIYHTLIIYFFNGFSLIQRGMIISDYVTRKSIQGLGNILPYYTLTCPILYVWVLGKLRERRGSEFSKSQKPKLHGKVVPIGEVYYENLRILWTK